MQKTELYRRGFVVPLDKKSMLSLEKNRIDENINVQYLEIANDYLFECLWESGIFERINKDINLLIDDYEEEIIENKNINKFKSIISEYIDNYPYNIEHKNFLLELISLSNIAVKCNTSMFVIF